MTQALNDRVAVITGGTTGIGLAIAKAFVAQGAKVVVTDLDQEAIDKAVKDIGPSSFGAKADAANITEMDALLKNVRAKHGRLDTVIANAVKDEHASLGQITEAQFDKMVGINLKGVLFTIQSAVPLMQAGGTIILIGSTASVAPPAGMSIYGAIKASFRGMVRALIRDLADDHGVGVGLVLHDIDQAGAVADRVLLLEAGRVTADGPPAEVLTTENLSRAYGLRVDVHIDPVDNRVTTRAVGRYNDAGLRRPATA